MVIRGAFVLLFGDSVRIEWACGTEKLLLLLLQSNNTQLCPLYKHNNVVESCRMYDFKL